MTAQKRIARLFSFLAFTAFTLLTAVAWAHKPSDSYLTVAASGEVVAVRWDIALRDLDYAIGADPDEDGAITWGELLARSDAVARYAEDRLSFAADGAPCPAAQGAAADAARSIRVVGHSDGNYAVLDLAYRCPAAPRRLDVDYRLLFDVDPQHRGLARVDAGGTTRTAIFSSTARVQTLDLEGTSRWRAFVAITREGIGHIWSGYDHLLFLLALLLPSVLSRRDAEWEPIPRLRPVMLDVLRVVTSFTVAHSITLSLAALQVVSLPSRFVESAIAASVIVAAVNNVVPFLERDRWVAAFALGLLHGFGFSATLIDLGLPRSHLLPTLFGFNLGVEIGQIAVVVAFLPIAFALRRTVAYRRVALIGGSCVISLIASAWLVERAFAVRIFS